VVDIAKKIPVDEQTEEPVFKFPEFDEVSYVKKELKDTKGALIVVLLGVIFAVISFLLTLIQQPGIGFIVGLIGLASIKYVLTGVKVDTSSYKIKNWLGHIGSYFFIWLAVWILLMNAPFSDFARPTIKDIAVASITGTNTTWCELKNYTEETHAVVKNTSSVTALSISAFVTDNGGLRSVKLVDKDGREVAQGDKTDANRYYWNISNINFRPGDSMRVTIIASDNAGNIAKHVILIDFQ